MKTVTEFANIQMQNALKAKADLAASGKSPEEIQQGLREAFKLAEEKVTHFMAALDVAQANSENLKRILVMSLADGEKTPHKATQVGEYFYVPEFHAHATPAQAAKSVGKSGRGGRGGRDGGKGRNGGPKESPWGASPEELKAKSNKGPQTKGNKPNPV